METVFHLKKEPSYTFMQERRGEKSHQVISRVAFMHHLARTDHSGLISPACEAELSYRTTPLHTFTRGPVRHHLLNPLHE